MIHTGNQNKTGQLGDGTNPSPEERRNVLLRAANGRCFHKTHRLRDFLLYVGTRAIEGREQEITEHQIGIQVFERGESFNPAEDNIVRSTARTLRVKLREHFDGEGRAEPCRIEIPKGSYIPVFTATPSEPTPPRTGGINRWLLAATVVLAAATAWLGWRLYAARTPANIFSALMGDAEALSVVCSDSLHAQYQILRGQLTPLEDYASGQLFTAEPPAGSDPRLTALWPLIRGQLLSNQEDLRIAMRLAHSIGAAKRVDLRHPRTLRMTDFRDGGDFLLMAARRANPWVGLFEANLNFQMVFTDLANVAEIHNSKPAASEQAVYLTAINGKRTGKSYGRIALVPGLSGKGRVLLVAGTTGQATDAAGEALLNPDSLREVERRLHHKLDGNTTRLEILLETAAVGGSTRDYRILSVR